MPFNAIHEYDPVVAGNNTDIGGSNIAEGCAPSGINNALRELARQVRAAVANQGSDIASATTTDIGAATGQYVRVTGATTITSLGSVNAGAMRWVEFAGALTVTQRLIAEATRLCEHHDRDRRCGAVHLARLRELEMRLVQPRRWLADFPRLDRHHHQRRCRRDRGPVVRR